MYNLATGTIPPLNRDQREDITVSLFPEACNLNVATLILPVYLFSVSAISSPVISRPLTKTPLPCLVFLRLITTPQHTDLPRHHFLSHNYFRSIFVRPYKLGPVHSPNHLPCAISPRPHEHRQVTQPLFTSLIVVFSFTSIASRFFSFLPSTASPITRNHHPESHSTKTDC